MQLSKEKLQHFVNNMPEKIDVVELIDKVLLMAKIEQSEESVDNHHIPHDEVEKEMDLWA
ncbi:MAG TPA: hypothetical protein VHS53_06700 [Mucilaginibacter sp.]|jgi:methionine salvage enolase-phosphatase E1|nr:hypothetical protein [Mucilaginibacter sp.]